jgi:hypothetical protein
MNRVHPGNLAANQNVRYSYEVSRASFLISDKIKYNMLKSNALSSYDRKHGLMPNPGFFPTIM